MFPPRLRWPAAPTSMGLVTPAHLQEFQLTGERLKLGCCCGTNAHTRDRALGHNGSACIFDEDHGQASGLRFGLKLLQRRRGGTLEHDLGHACGEPGRPGLRRCLQERGHGGVSNLSGQLALGQTKLRVDNDDLLEFLGGHVGGDVRRECSGSGAQLQMPCHGEGGTVGGEHNGSEQQNGGSEQQSSGREMKDEGVTEEECRGGEDDGDGCHDERERVGQANEEARAVPACKDAGEHADDGGGRCERGKHLKGLRLTFQLSGRRPMQEERRRR